MGISFHNIPASILTPGVYVEFDASRAVQGLAPRPNDCLILAQMLASGTAAAEVPVLVTSADEAASLFGIESQAHECVSAFKAVYPFAPLWVIPYADAGGAVKAAGSITWTGTATEAGTLVLYVGGRRIEVAVSSGDSAATVETTALAACALVAGALPVTYAGDAATGVDFTARHAGTIGNQILLGVCLQPGEKVPAGLTVTVTAMASGATDTTLAASITAMGEDQYATIVVANNDATEVARVVTELESRWLPMRAIEGSAFTCKQDSASNLNTYAAGFNSGMLVPLCVEKSAAMALPWEIAAQAAAISAAQNDADPSKDTTLTSFVGLSAAPRGSRFTQAQRNTILVNGGATVIAGSDGRMIVERMVTSYKTNALSLPDTAFQDHRVVRLLAAIRFTWRARIASKFLGWKLADDGNEISGQQIVTPSGLKSEALAWYGDLCDAGWAMNPDDFKANVLIQRDGSDKNRVNMILPPDLIRTLFVAAAQIQFA